ncbi:unnamed protein product, partial [Prunus brigantina]
WIPSNSKHPELYRVEEIGWGKKIWGKEIGRKGEEIGRENLGRVFRDVEYVLVNVPKTGYALVNDPIGWGVYYSLPLFFF